MMGSRVKLFVSIFFWLVPMITISLGMASCLLDKEYGQPDALSIVLNDAFLLVAMSYLIIMLASVLTNVIFHRLPISAFLLALLHCGLLVAIYAMLMIPYFIVTYIYFGGEFYGMTGADGWPIKLGHYLATYAVWYGVSGRFLLKLLYQAVTPVTSTID